MVARCLAAEICPSIFSSPGPKALRGAYRMVASAARQHFQRTSALKPLSQFQQNYIIMQPPGQGGKKVYILNPSHMTKIAVITIYGKNIKKISRITESIANKFDM